MPVMTQPAMIPEAGVNKSTRRRKALLSQRLQVLWMVLGTTTSVVVSGSFALVMAYRRDATTVAGFLGAIFNGILSKLLKKMIQQARPSPSSSDHASLAQAASLTKAKGTNDSSKNKQHYSENGLPRYGVGEEEGMPSSHSMSLAFIWAFAALHYPPDNNINSNNNTAEDHHHHHLFLHLPSRLVAMSVSLVYVLTCATYRIHAKLHTWQQVLVGLTLGVLHAWLFVRYVEPELTTWITAHVLTTTTANNDDNNVDARDTEEQRILPAPWLVIPFTMTILIGAKVDLKIMQWLSNKKMNNNKTVQQQVQVPGSKKTR
jgi:membrane-associated phospholipid phosphatase